MLSSYFRLLLLLSALTMAGPLAIDAYLPSFQAIEAELHADEFSMQLTLSLFLYAFAAMMLFYGVLSDAFGRRRVVLWALAVYALGSLGAALSTSIEALWLFRILQGLGAGGGTVVGRAIVRDRFTGAQAQRMMSHMTMVFGLAPAIAPVLGGWLQVTLGWRWIFGFSFVFGAVLWLLCWRSLAESLPSNQRQPFHPRALWAQYAACLTHARFMLLIMVIATVFAGFSIYIGSASHFVMGILGLSETAFGWMFIPLVGGLVLGSALAGRLAHHCSRSQFVWMAFTVLALAVVCNVGYHLWVQQMGQSPRVPWAVVPLFMYGFGISLLSPSVTMSAMDFFPRNQGLASSLQSFVQMTLFATTSGFIVPLLYDSGLKLALGMCCAAAAGLCCYALCGALMRHQPVHDAR